MDLSEDDVQQRVEADRREVERIGTYGVCPCGEMDGGIARYGYSRSAGDIAVHPLTRLPRLIRGPLSCVGSSVRCHGVCRRTFTMICESEVTSVPGAGN
jgi:hypothetical protein